MSILAIVIPNFNQSHFLPAALKSLTYQNATFNLAVMDMGSTDNYKEVVNKMENALAMLGLLVIILGWLVQLYYSATKKVFVLSIRFVAIYVVGCILLVIDALQTGNTRIFVLNLVTAVAALLTGYFAKKARI
jgi:glycosyltransferase involved in cell wall biosynthesis